jgi:hypothetical protein
MKNKYKMKYLLSCIALLLLICACSDNNSEDKMPAEFLLLNGTDFIMVVDRVAESPDVHFPGDRLEERDYTPFTGEKRYTVIFSTDRQKVSLEPGAIVGEISDSGAGAVEYELNDSLFAGGRFVVWISNDNFRAELTIFGSGIPILSSERGNLLPE